MIKSDRGASLIAHKMGDNEQPPLEADLDAGQVFLLMNKQYRISRTRRAEWFFTRLNTFVTIPESINPEETDEEFDVISIIPKKPPSNWDCNTSHMFRYRICSDTTISVISKKYRFVYCIDISPSVAAVDVQTSSVMFDGIFDALRNSMMSLAKPFYVPGSKYLFRPKIYTTIIAHSSFLALNVEQILVQGVILNESTCMEILRTAFIKLQLLETKVVKISTSSDKVQAVQQTPVPKLRNEEGDGEVLNIASISMSPDFALVDLFRHAVIALGLLPENSTAGLIVITDGAISVPDGGYLDMVLSQLRYNTISCSFIQLSSPFHPHVCYGVLPYTDFMKFIANATCGAFLTSVPSIEMPNLEMNLYHEAFLFWKFQSRVNNGAVNPFNPAIRPGVWSVRNKCFFSIRDMPIVKKQQYETTLVVDYLKVLSCRLREGFTIKEVTCLTDTIQIKLTLAWKFLIFVEYILITQWPPQQKVTCIVSIEGPYDFLHDVTCLAKKPFHSYYRQLMVSRFWGYQKNLSESDKLLVHFNSFCTSPVYYNIPDSLRNGVPLFCISSNTSSPVLQSSDFAYPQFAQFWKPVSLLDTNIWQKWMHTHRVGILLEHDHPFPKHLHIPFSSGRYHVIQCRQTMMALSTMLKDWSSFVLVENHSYIKFMYNQPHPVPPFSFCLIRTTTKPPCLVLRLAFLVGTPGHLRNSVVQHLVQKISGLTFPQRLNEPPRWRIYKSNTVATASDSDSSPKIPFKRTWSDMPCCILLKKPVEKILIRYERTPTNFFQTLLPQQSYNSWPNSKRSTGVESTFGFRATYSSTWGSNIKMGPEMFNTVARYLTHRRWIWCVQSTPACPLSMECAARILSTITKMRLQEGLRFAFSSSGIINMVKELEMKMELSQSSSNVEPCASPCVFQYVLFPPITTLFCADGEEEPEKPGEETELYLVCECWVEPQSGKVMDGTDFDGLSYSEIHDKVFEIDLESISALVTFEHLSLMCQNSKVPSPTEVPERELKRPASIISTEDNVQYIPFSFDLTRILPKSQQVEVLFSSFNQILSLAVSKGEESSELYDHSNMLLYTEVCGMLEKANHREVLLAPHESRAIHEYIRGRNWKSVERVETSAAKGSKMKTLPKWKCYVKGVSESHVLLTFLPATFNDLKMITLANDAPDPSKYISQLPSDEAMEEELCCVRASLKCISQESRSDSVFINPFEGIVLTQEYPNSCESSLSRKRIRVKSGGESGPASKKALTRRTSIDNIFRIRANSADRPFRASGQLGRGKTASGDGSVTTLTTESSPMHTNTASGSSLEEKLSEKKLNFENVKTQYGSLGLPMFIFDCSLATVTDHIIFRSNSTAEDKYIDYRYTSCQDENILAGSGDFEGEETKTTYGSPIKRKSPEPKSDDSEFLPSDVEAMQKHCRFLEEEFIKSFVHGMFQSLQSSQYIYRGDVELALRLCRDTKVGTDLKEFIEATCCHSTFTSSGGTEQPQSEGKSASRHASGCSRPNADHKFIHKRFQNIILSTFENVPEVPGVFFYKPSAQNSTLGLGRQTSEQSRSSLHTADGAQGISRSSFNNRSLYNSTDAKRSSKCTSLFMYLTCTYLREESSCAFLVQQLPTCLEDVKEILGSNIPDFKFDEKTTLRMDYVFLTPEALSNEENETDSSVPPCKPSEQGRKLQKLPEYQLQAINTMIEEVDWLLRDEITSLRGVSSALNENTLQLVASHVEASNGKGGCRVATVPLTFVENAGDEGYEKFKKRFGNLSIDGFELKEEGMWYYLADVRLRRLTSIERTRDNHNMIRKQEAELNAAVVAGLSSEVVEVDEKMTSSNSRKMSGSGQDLSSSDTLNKETPKQPADQPEAVGRFLLTTPSQLSEISSLVDSLVTTAGEDGYEGDGSESGEDAFTKSCQDLSKRNNAFWMIFKLTKEHVKIFFHCRYNEDNLSLYNYSMRLCERIINKNKDLKRLVNQDLLLQELETTRKCNMLLENNEEYLDYGGFRSGLVTPVRQPSGESEIDPVKSAAPGIFSCPIMWETKFVLHSRLGTGLGKSLTSRGIQALKAALLIFEVTNRRNMFVYKDTSGSIFYLRLYRVQESSGELISDMSSLNLVGKEQDPPWVDSSSEEMRPRSGSTNERELAKLRDCEVNEEEKTEDVVLLQVHGISPAGSEIKEQLAQSLRNKLDDAVLDIVFVTLDRNPHCKLTPEDVHFIQKPNSAPDSIVKFQINDYVREHLSAFGYYMHQNLLNFFSMPKYTDLKLENHFRDYSRELIESEKNIYLYKQNPGETGSRGIACLVVTMVGPNFQPLPAMSWVLPSSSRTKQPRRIEDLIGYVTDIKEVLSDDGNQDAMVELQIWKQGRINLDLLRSYLSSVIKYSIWDLLTEFYYVTAPLSIDVPTISVESTVQTLKGTQEKPAASAQRGSLLSLSPRRNKVDPLTVGLTKLETGDKGQLHPIYLELRKWCNFGNDLAVPSLRIAPVDLHCHYPVEIIAQELEKLINMVMNEVGPKQFWKNNEIFMSLGAMQSTQSKKLAQAHKFRQEFNSFTTNLNKLAGNEQSVTHHFKDREDFNPNEEGSHCILIARNMIHWKACTTTANFESLTPDGNTHHYRFPPLLSASKETHFLGLKTVEIAPDSPTQAMNPTKPGHPILVPRQKLLWAHITDSKILYMFYNWSKDGSDRLLDHTKRTCAWFNAKASLLAALYAQKSGLFHDQALVRSASHALHIECGMNPYSTDIDTYILYQAPPKSIFVNRTTGPVKKSKISTLLLPCLDALRNIKHQDTFLAPADFINNPFKSQFMQLKLAAKTGSKNYQDWLQGNVNSTNSDEVIYVFKKSARLVHFCMTPIIFFPRWRREVSATRDIVTGIRKKTTSEFRRAPAAREDKRSRHGSDSSQKSLEAPGVKPKSKSSIWPLWSGSNANLETQPQTTAPTSPFAKKTDDKWHTLVCESFMKEYVQYLETLTFIPISVKAASGALRGDQEKERVRQISGSSAVSVASLSSQSSGTAQTFSSFENAPPSMRLRENSGGGQVQYLQKHLPGGIILFEVGFDEPFFYTKIYALESSLQVTRPLRTTSHEDTLTFLEECETVKASMHLHSFTYDFHLRSIHAYIAGRQVPFKPGYHLTNFLDDFVKYYAKGPSFARNTVHIGLITLQNVSTPSHILYDYLLTHDKLYQMKVLATNTGSSPEKGSENSEEYVLFKLYSKKVTYKNDDADTERQYDEFDLILLIAYDAPLMIRPYSSDPSVLRLKYYIILTSRRDVYPTLSEDGDDIEGKLSMVNAPDVLSNYRVLNQGKTHQSDHRVDSKRKFSEEQQRLQQEAFKMSRRGSEDFTESGAEAPFTGIKEELIHYMGYFSSHEQVMQKIVTEEISAVESFIHAMVQQAAVDCRRDLLWQRLLIGEKCDDKRKNQKQDLISRETVGELSYWEFGELLELVYVKSLSEMDPRLFILLRQPISFYQNLIRLISLGNLHYHRHFVAPDESVHQVALFCNRVDHAVIMLEICFEKRSADLSILFKHKSVQLESTAQLEPEVLSLIESVINMCCYCAWGNLA